MRGESIPVGEEAFLTPSPRYRPGLGGPTGPAAHGEAPGSGRGASGTRRALRRVIAGTSALACAGALVAGTVVPASNALIADGASASSQPQLMSTGGTTTSDIVLPESIPAVETAPPMGADGKPNLSLAGLKDTKLRYPFDSEVPLTDPFGYRTAPVAQFHEAQDMGAGAGTPIRIVGDGVVSEAGFATDGCGFALSVEHKVNGQAVTSRYCHMQANSHSYQVGDRVKGGDQAGLVGETGMAFGAHLHMILRLENQPIDPLPFIAKNSK
ncbi:M23 family metallopeptidase [Leucobacter sp. wl10]|uniref:M23 family metallopeptidase n=1 Tax=Leucobacter sp. wl10 TaxID=2304677 RepID=UPI000E5C320C|nr:M23 family metallopeptidase [Leucobacter sp. wl10]RGE21473.1 M23 family peptidase [Leucobacter sp. wl10]